jgi:hypothetical protein
VNAFPRTRSVTRQLAWGLVALLLLCGGAGLILGGSHFAIRALALVAVIAAARLFQTLRARSLGGTDSRGAAAPITPLYWFVGIVLAALTAVSFYALVRDAEGGYQDVAPVYSFAAAGLAFALWGGVLAARYSR